MNWSNYECKGQMSIFDLLEQEPIIVPVAESRMEFEEILKKGLFRYGTGFVNGKVRVHRILQKDIPEKDKIAAIRKEFGLGGCHSAPEYNEIHGIDTMGNSLKVEWSDAEGVKEESISWPQVYKYIKKWDDAGEYCNIRFYSEEIKVDRHYFCNGNMYLRVTKDSEIYAKPGMVVWKIVICIWSLVRIKNTKMSSILSKELYWIMGGVFLELVALGTYISRS